MVKENIGCLSVKRIGHTYTINWTIRGFFMYNYPFNSFKCTSPVFKMWETEWACSYSFYPPTELEQYKVIRHGIFGLNLYLRPVRPMREMEKMSFTCGILSDCGRVYKIANPSSATESAFESFNIISEVKLCKDKNIISSKNDITFFFTISPRESIWRFLWGSDVMRIVPLSEMGDLCDTCGKILLSENQRKDLIDSNEEVLNDYYLKYGLNSCFCEFIDMEWFDLLNYELMDTCSCGKYILKDEARRQFLSNRTVSMFSSGDLPWNDKLCFCTRKNKRELRGPPPRRHKKEKELSPAPSTPADKLKDFKDTDTKGSEANFYIKDNGDDVENRGDGEVIYCEDEENNSKNEGEEYFGTKDVNFLQQNLKEMFLKKKNCDLVINVGDREFSVHKSILTAHSTVFASMFEHKMKENESNSIDIEDCNPDAFGDFLLYLYSGKVDNLSENVTALHYLADKYDVKQLAERCIQFMVKHVAVESFCDFLAVAVKHNEPTLIKSTQTFFSENMRKILLTETWQTFIKENPIIVNELLIKCATK